MKISKRKLKNLIENYLYEIETDNLNSKKAIGVGAASAIVYLAGKKLFDLTKLYNILKPYQEAKEEADIKDCDLYIHYLAFFTGVIEIGESDPNVKKNLITLGNAKELLDAIASTTSVLRVGWKKSMKEWEKDMQSNLKGIEDGLKVLRGEMTLDEGIDIAYSRLKYIPSPKGIEAWKNKYQLKEFFDKYPKLYGEGKTFIQPRYNAKLSIEDRQRGWEIWMKRNNKPMPRWAKKLKGPLQC